MTSATLYQRGRTRSRLFALLQLLPLHHQPWDSFLVTLAQLFAKEGLVSFISPIHRAKLNSTITISIWAFPLRFHSPFTVILTELSVNPKPAQDCRRSHHTEPFINFHTAAQESGVRWISHHVCHTYLHQPSSITAAEIERSQLFSTFTGHLEEGTIMCHKKGEEEG